MRNPLLQLLETDQLAPALPQNEAEALSEEILNNLTNLRVYPRSITATGRTLYFLGLREDRRCLGIVSTQRAISDRFEGNRQTATVDGFELNVTVAPTSSRNAAVLRGMLPFLKARTIGLKKTAGCGDRLGFATPGHVRSIRKTRMAPIFAQQSVRENARTGRSPQGVMDDAMWGVFQEGWREGFGADADHLKTTADIDDFVAAGYSFFTIDPGEHVDNSADGTSNES